MVKTSKVVTVVIFCFLISVASSFAQEAYPSKPIQIVVPAAPGGAMDLMARVLAEKFREFLGQPVIVVNKTGGSLAIGMQYVLNSKADGYTLFTSGGPAFTLIQFMNPNVTIGLNDFSAVAGFGRYPQTIVVNKDLPVKNLAELAAYAKKNPKALSYGTTGFGGVDHLGFELFKIAFNVPMENIPLIPYPGAAPAITALLGNQIQVGSLPFSALIQKHIEAGALRGLAISSPKRFSFGPAIPTAIEAGLPDLNVYHFHSFWVPAKTPVPIIRKLEETTRRALENKEVRARIEEMFDEAEFVSSQELQKYAEEGVTKWGGLIKKLNITVK
jgi:tripartite-type tricarboxylate transporter receptor subunit TctC